MELDENNGDPVLRTNIYSVIKDFRAGMIHSDILGEAFEPEQRFENPDGTDIVFDADYYGNHRGIDVLPGPFAEAAECFAKLWK
ncbi:MAG: hypothetical protein IJI07_03550 [Flexilinea sp.]|nr:hypothetical protein [Flexilinea sp.]